VVSYGKETYNQTGLTKW